jgi:hypothetical protein
MEDFRKMIARIRNLGLCALILLTLAGCGGTTSSPAATASVPGGETAYPAPAATTAEPSAYPAPAVTTAEPSAYPAP